MGEDELNACVLGFVSNYASEPSELYNHLPLLNTYTHCFEM